MHYISWVRPTNNSLYLFSCNMHPIAVNLVPKEGDSVAEKLTFAQFQVKPKLMHWTNTAKTCHKWEA